MRKLACLMGLLFLVSLSAAAQDNPKLEVFGGYELLHVTPGSGSKSANLNGVTGDFSYAMNSWLAVTGKFTTDENKNVNMSNVKVISETFMAGPKLFVNMGKLTPFGETLLGGAHISGTPIAGSTAFNTVSASSLAWSIGGGLDWNVYPHVGVRLGQVDYLMTRFGNNSSFSNGTSSHQNNFRYSAGIVLRF